MIMIHITNQYPKVKGVNYNKITLPSKKYFSSNHVFTFEKPIITKNLALKLYSRYTNGKQLPSKFVNECRTFIEEKIKTKDFTFERGIGFVIASKNLISINRWGGKNPSKLIQIIYSFKLRNLDEATILNIKKEGVYSLGELGLIANEGYIWRFNNEDIQFYEETMKLTKKQKIDRYLLTSAL